MRFLTSMLVAAGAYLCSSSVGVLGHSPDYQVHKHWNKLAATPQQQLIRLDIAIKQNITGLIELANAVEAISDPTNDLYGSWYTLEQVGQLVSPPQSNIDAISNFFSSNNAVSISFTQNKDFATVYMYPNDAMVAFTGINGTSTGYGYHVYSHKAVPSYQLHRMNLNSVQLKAAMANSNYASIADYIDLIQGLNDYPNDFPTPSTTPDMNSTSPDIFPAGSQNTLQVEILAYCSNGKRSKSTSINSAPCTEMGLSGIQTLNLTVAPQGYPEQNYGFSLNDAAWNASYVGTGIFVTPFYNIPDWIKVNITAQATYADGSVSALGGFPNDNTFKLYAPTIYSTVNDIREYYGVPKGYRATNGSQAIFEAEFQYIYPPDTDLFFTTNGIAPSEVYYVGSNDYASQQNGFIANADGGGGESQGDLQTIAGIAQGVPTTVWQVSGPANVTYNGIPVIDPFPGPASLQGTVPPGQGAYLLAWAMQYANTSDADVPLVVSFSYGDTELGLTQKFGSLVYLQRLEQEALKISARGITLVNAAGDAGTTNAGAAYNDVSSVDQTCTPFLSSYPSVSNYFTTVSSSFFTPFTLPINDDVNQVDGDYSQTVSSLNIGEAVVGIAQGSTYTTGGGFANLSSLFPQLPYQKEVVQQYIAQQTAAGTLPPGGAIDGSGFWNPSGRALPDVSAIGTNVLTISAGEPSLFAGTSCAAPIFAGIVSLLNNELLNAGYPPVGRLNPLLYYAAQVNPASFNDIIVGNNNGGEEYPHSSTYPSECPYGFSASTGWDAVSGLGSPNFEQLVSVALKAAERARQARANANTQSLLSSAQANQTTEGAAIANTYITYTNNITSSSSGASSQSSMKSALFRKLF